MKSLLRNFKFTLLSTFLMTALLGPPGGGVVGALVGLPFDALAHRRRRRKTSEISIREPFVWRASSLEPMIALLWCWASSIVIVVLYSIVIYGLASAEIVDDWIDATKTTVDWLALWIPAIDFQRSALSKANLDAAIDSVRHIYASFFVILAFQIPVCLYVLGKAIKGSAEVVARWNRNRELGGVQLIATMVASGLLLPGLFFAGLYVLYLGDWSEQFLYEQHLPESFYIYFLNLVAAGIIGSSAIPMVVFFLFLFALSVERFRQRSAP